MNRQFSEPSLEELVARYRPGFSLEAPFYNSKQIFDLEMDLIFSRHWIYVGPAAAIPEPGDYTTVDFGPYSVILLRDDDMTVRAFHNVCRHRGARMLNGSGTIGNIVCPYHQWTYNGGGELIHCEDENLDKSCYGLKNVHVRDLSGLLYICLAAEPPRDFDELRDAVAPYLAPHKLQDTKIAVQIDLVEEGNWKLTMENNRECYHCGSHPELLETVFGIIGIDLDNPPPDKVDAVAQFRSAESELHAMCKIKGFPFRASEHLDDRVTAFRIERRPMTAAGESFTIDGRAASKRLLGDFEHPRSGFLTFHQQPNAWHHFLADHVITFTVLPLTPTRTLVRTTWLVHKDAVEGVDYDRENLIRVWDATNRQDQTFVELAQEGSANPFYEPGPYSPSESMVEQFLRWYITQLKVQMDTDKIDRIAAE